MKKLLSILLFLFSLILSGQDITILKSTDTIYWYKGDRSSLSVIGREYNQYPYATDLSISGYFNPDSTLTARSKITDINGDSCWTMYRFGYSADSIGSLTYLTDWSLDSTYIIPDSLNGYWIGQQTLPKALTGGRTGKIIESYKDSIIKIVNLNYLGFLPATTDYVNVSIWNSIPAGGIVEITIPGIYEIDGTLWLQSNTIYNFCEGITIKKKTNHITSKIFSYIFANKGMLTGVRDSFIYFYGNGIDLDVNGVDNYSLTDTDITPVFRTRGNFQFFRVDNFVVDDIFGNNLDMVNQFFTSFYDCNSGVITNIDVTADKDAINFVSSSNIYASNLKLYTRDDNIFIGVGYYSTTPVLKDCRNIIITDSELNSSEGFCLRFFADSWSQWVNGQTYKWNESCINNGRIYTNATEGSTVASVAPTHTSGPITGADGITWWHVQNGTITSINIKNVTLSNTTITSISKFCDLANITTTTGTDENGLIDSIIIDNITFSGDFAGYFFAHSGHVGTLTLSNTSYVSKGTGGFFYSGVIALRGKASFDELIMDNITFSGENGWFMPWHGYTSDYSFSKITMIDCNIGFNGTVSPYNRVFKVLAGVLDNVNAINCVGTTFNNIGWVWYNSAINLTSTIKLTNCAFTTSVAYIGVVATYTGCNFNYISTGTAYINPVSHLFINVKEQDALTIDLSTSSGTVPAAKVRSSSLVKVIQCDLPYE